MAVCSYTQVLRDDIIIIIIIVIVITLVSSNRNKSNFKDLKVIFYCSLKSVSAISYQHSSNSFI